MGHIGVCSPSVIKDMDSKSKLYTIPEIPTCSTSGTSAQLKVEIVINLTHSRRHVNKNLYSLKDNGTLNHGYGLGYDINNK